MVNYDKSFHLIYIKDYLSQIVQKVAAMNSYLRALSHEACILEQAESPGLAYVLKMLFDPLDFALKHSSLKNGKDHNIN